MIAAIIIIAIIAIAIAYQQGQNDNENEGRWVAQEYHRRMGMMGHPYPNYGQMGMPTIMPPTSYRNEGRPLNSPRSSKTMMVIFGLLVFGGVIVYFIGENPATKPVADTNKPGGQTATPDDRTVFNTENNNLPTQSAPNSTAMETEFDTAALLRERGIVQAKSPDRYSDTGDIEYEPVFKPLFKTGFTIQLVSLEDENQIMAWHHVLLAEGIPSRIQSVIKDGKLMYRLFAGNAASKQDLNTLYQQLDQRFGKQSPLIRSIENILLDDKGLYQYDPF